MRGFTLIELMLSVSLFTILAGIMVPVSQSLQNRTDLDGAIGTITSMIRQAEFLSQNSSGSSPWGIYLETGKATVFNGTSYVSRDTDKDRVADFSPAISVSGINEIIFSGITGEPDQTGDIILENTRNEDRIISINSRGGLLY